jgi:quercetin dioxygenase-like cupin family protein
MLLPAIVLCLPAASPATDAGAAKAVVNTAEMVFQPTPGLPDCAANAVLSGDPTKGPSILLGRIESSCVVPWHWHTPNENLMLVSGIAELTMRGGKPERLQAGGFARMPGRHVHQFRCVEACLMYVYSDGAFDIHYVDEQGAEIPADRAIGAAGASGS